MCAAAARGARGRGRSPRAPRRARPRRRRAPRTPRRRARRHPRERRLAGARRPVEDHRVRLARTRSRCAAPSPRRAGAPGRRTPRACAGACRAASGAVGRRLAAPPAASSGSRRAGPCAQYGVPRLRSTHGDSPTRCRTRPPRSSPQLIRFNTVNPPGNERECQEWLRGLPRGRRARVRARRRRARAARTSSRGCAARPTGPVLGYLSPRRHRARRRRGLDARPVVAARSTTASCGAAARST